MVKGGHRVLRLQGVGLGGLERLGRKLALLPLSGDLVFLYGPLGAGKTTFVRSVAEALAVSLIRYATRRSP